VGAEHEPDSLCIHPFFGCSNRLTQTRKRPATSKPTGDGDGDVNEPSVLVAPIFCGEKTARMSFFPLRRPADLAPAPTSPLACQVQGSRQGGFV